MNDPINDPITVENLGVINKMHVSGIVETDKGQKFVKNADTERGDILLRVDGSKKIIVSKARYEELYRKYVADDEKKVKYQKGVTVGLRAIAKAAGIAVTPEMSKAEVLAAIEAAKASDPTGTTGGEGNAEGGEDV